jgi:hypothetical protein
MPIGQQPLTPRGGVSMQPGGTLSPRESRGNYVHVALKCAAAIPSAAAFLV